ncbi:adenylate kinase [Sulfurovum sp. zt1-1]|uniref:Adenylate kinase n=1 Tax=Sulfurovum zhangzhouensis TaxID=3019067 RepID=A0ABT7QY51_9BACT|nr:adenylate kinase [Sulfurovum zhangzhouensis]MDM5271708.1 adenylate kinase [Sulfurovum zhangzhouensis]
MAKKLFLVIGAPGSGKTTDANLIASRHKEHIVHYSTGDMLRDEIASGSKLGETINSYIKQGELVPLEIIMDTVITAIKYAPTDVVVIDGFPRSIEQMKAFDDILSMEDDIHLVSVIEVRVCEEIARERILGRAAEAAPGQIRSDDKEEVFYERMKIYNEPLEAIQEFYTEKRLLKVIDGEKPLDIVVSMMELFILSRTSVPSIHISNDSYRAVRI